MTECEEVATSLYDKAKDYRCNTADRVRLFVQIEMDGETQTIINNVAEYLNVLLGHKA